MFAMIPRAGRSGRLRVPAAIYLGAQKLLFRRLLGHLGQTTTHRLPKNRGIRYGRAKLCWTEMSQPMNLGDILNWKPEMNNSGRHVKSLVWHSSQHSTDQAGTIYNTHERVSRITRKIPVKQEVQLSGFFVKNC
jgi:hypothetical protein